MSTPFFKLVERINKPTPAEEWLASPHVTQAIAKWKAEDNEFDLNNWIGTKNERPSTRL